MRERFQIPIPMWRVQFQLQGGHHRVWMIAAIVVSLEIVAAFGFRRAMQREPLNDVCQMMLYALAAFQIGLMFLGGSNAIYRAMLRDYESKMIESHRMTPMSNIGVALGYVFGPTLLVSLLFVATMLFGAFVAELADAELDQWFSAHALILISAVSVWALVVLWGMRIGKPFSPAPIVVGISAFSFPLAMHPGAGAVLGLYGVSLAFAACVDRGSITAEAFVGLSLVSGLATCFWIGLAAAKYRRPDLPVLNFWRGLLMLFLWMVLSTVGYVAWDSVSSALLGRRDPDLALVQWIATLVSGCCVGSLVVMATASSSILVRQGRMPRSRGDRVHEIPVAILAAIVICGVMFAVGGLAPAATTAIPPARTPTMEVGRMLGPWMASLIACLSALLAAGALFRLAAARLKLKSPLAFSLTVMGVWWAVPAIGDLLRAQIVSGPREPVFSALLGMSPAGAIVAIWVPVDIPLEIGLAVQAGLTLLLVGLSHPFARSVDGSQSRAG